MIKVVCKLSEIEQAIEAVDKLKAELPGKLHELLIQLCQAGVEIASAKLLSMDAIETGELNSSISYAVSADGKTGYIRADSGHAMYVEFGTGVKGQASPHPTMPWAYDVNGHGNAGWWYPTTPDDPNPVKQTGKDGSLWAWTRGMRSRPFMWETSQELAKKTAETAKEVFVGD